MENEKKPQRTLFLPPKAAPHKLQRMKLFPEWHREKYDVVTFISLRKTENNSCESERLKILLIHCD